MKGFMHALKKKKSEKKSKSESSSSRSSNNNASFTKIIVHNCCVQFCSVPFVVAVTYHFNATACKGGAEPSVMIL
jgi:hypothetical protein